MHLSTYPKWPLPRTETLVNSLSSHDTFFGVENDLNYCYSWVLDKFIKPYSLEDEVTPIKFWSCY